MKISNLNTVTFKGIKVNGREEKEKQNKPLYSRQAQHQVIDDWGKTITTFQETINSIADNPTLEQTKKDAIDASHFSKLPKDEYDKVMTKIKEDGTPVEIRKNMADRLVDLSYEYIERIKELDRQDRESGYKNFYALTKHPSKGLDKIAGYNEELQILDEEFINKVQKEKQGEDVDIFGSILFFGPYGNGKTHITKTIAEVTGCKIEKIPHIIPSNPKSQEKAMQKIYDIAQNSEEQFSKNRTRTIIFIDEADRLINNNSPVTKDFEDFIKTCSEKYHCSVFAATNEPLKLGVNYKDSDVFPVKMSIEPPEGENAKSVLKHYIQPYTTENINYEALTSALEQREKDTDAKFSNGQLHKMSKEIKFANSKDIISQNDFLNCIQNTEPELSSDIIKKFEEAKINLIG